MKRNPGDMLKAFQAKKHKLAPALTASHNPGSMPGFAAKSKPVKVSPNSPQVYGPGMQRAMANTKVYGTPLKPTGAAPANPSWVKQKKAKRKGAATLPPKNFGKKRQTAYAKEFGIVPTASTRTRTKRKASKLDMEMAFKKKRKASAPLRNSAPLRGVTPGGIKPTSGGLPQRYVPANRLAKRKSSAKKKAMMGCA